MSSANKPIETNAVSIDTTVGLGDRKILCRGTHVYQLGHESQEQSDTLDPGLVMTGTKCGVDSVRITAQLGCGGMLVVAVAVCRVSNVVYQILSVKYVGQYFVFRNIWFS